MIIEEKYNNRNSGNSTENFTIQLTDSLLYDRLHTLSVEYSSSIEILVNVAVKRLIDDVDFVRSLRAGETKLE